MASEQDRISTVASWCATFLFTILFLPMVVSAEILFVVNKSVPVDTLDKTEIKRIFLGERSVWPDGEEIKLLIQDKTAVQKEFTRKYTQKSEAQFRNYWRKQMFTGKGILPEILSSDEAVLDFVSNTKGAIGYVSPKAAVNDVKPITISGD